MPNDKTISEKMSPPSSDIIKLMSSFLEENKLYGLNEFINPRRKVWIKKVNEKKTNHQINKRKKKLTVISIGNKEHSWLREATMNCQNRTNNICDSWNNGFTHLFGHALETRDIELKYRYKTQEDGFEHPKDGNW